MGLAGCTAGLNGQPIAAVSRGFGIRSTSSQTRGVIEQAIETLIVRRQLKEVGGLLTTVDPRVRCPVSNAWGDTTRWSGCPERPAGSRLRGPLRSSPLNFLGAMGVQSTESLYSTHAVSTNSRVVRRRPGSGTSACPAGVRRSI